MEYLRVNIACVCAFMARLRGEGGQKENHFYATHQFQTHSLSRHTHTHAHICFSLSLLQVSGLDLKGWIQNKGHRQTCCFYFRSYYSLGLPKYTHTLNWKHSVVRLSGARVELCVSIDLESQHYLKSRFYNLQCHFPNLKNGYQVN